MKSPSDYPLMSSLRAFDVLPRFSAYSTSHHVHNRCLPEHAGAIDHPRGSRLSGSRRRKIDRWLCFAAANGVRPCLTFATVLSALFRNFGFFFLCYDLGSSVRTSAPSRCTRSGGVGRPLVLIFQRRIAFFSPRADHLGSCLSTRRAAP